ncbi:hypothetical protein [Sutcliffiella horikoshii]|uniref:hypothetical protein n=1 Tax=Sutcliffiella horikoshii TaxID=79883 RepID=UPI001CFD15CC|nr:hypothetical protein [Sutcliffiella horikoshii]
MSNWIESAVPTKGSVCPSIISLKGYTCCGVDTPLETGAFGAPVFLWGKTSLLSAILV